MISFQTLKQPPWLSLGLLYKTCFGSSEEKPVLMQSPGLLIFLTSRSLTFNSNRYSIARSRLVVPLWTPLSVTVRTHPIKHFLNLFAGNKFTISRSASGTTVIVGMGGIGSALEVASATADCNKVVFFGRRNPEVCQPGHQGTFKSSS